MKKRLGALTAEMVNKALPIYGRSILNVLDECEDIIAAEEKADLEKKIGGTD